MKTYAVELKRKREAAGLTTRRLGDLIDKSSTFVTDFELARKANPPEPQVMTAFADVLGWSVADQLRAWGYALPDAPVALVNPFDRADIRHAVVEHMKAIELDGPDAPFWIGHFRLQIRMMRDIAAYGLDDPDLASVDDFEIVSEPEARAR